MVGGPRVRGISPVEKEKVYGGNDLPKSQVLSSEWKTERVHVREDASGDSEYGEDDELPSVIGESEGDGVSGARQCTSIAWRTIIMDRLHRKRIGLLKQQMQN